VDIRSNTSLSVSWFFSYPAVRIDLWDTRAGLIKASLSEIASFFDCNKSTISRRIATIITKGKDQGKIRLQFSESLKRYPVNNRKRTGK